MSNEIYNKYDLKKLNFKLIKQNQFKIGFINLNFIELINNQLKILLYFFD